jgi:SsrA-binding protein
MAGPGEHTVASNRRAFYEYAIEERFEAGIALHGTEVKSLRAGQVSLNEAYAQERDGEVWLVGASIEPYARGTTSNHQPRRERKLLLHGREIDRIHQRTAERGLTLIPLRLYFKAGRAKVELALARGKDVHDKRSAVSERDARREVDRALKERARGE